MKPNQTVTLELNGQRTVALADAVGTWSAQLQPRPAGGPYELKILAGGTRQTLRNILLGDVFLCSGQSNMEMPVGRALNSWSEVNSASNDRIRMAKIGRASTVTLQTSLPEPLVWLGRRPAVRRARRLVA